MDSPNRTGGMEEFDTRNRETTPEKESSIEGSRVLEEQVDAEVEEEAQAEEGTDKGEAKSLAPVKIGNYLPVPSDSPMVPQKTHAVGGAGDQPPAAVGSAAGRDMESLESALRENGFMPFDGRVDVEAVQDRLYEVLEQFARRGALVQELIVSREKSKLEERALQQKAAYFERDAAQLRKRIESTQHHHETERSARSPSEDKAKLSSRLSASQSRVDELIRAMRAKEQLADDLQGRLRLLISMEEKRKSFEQSAFKSCMGRDPRSGSGMDHRTLGALSGFMDEVKRQRGIIDELQGENRKLNIELRDMYNDRESVGDAAEARRDDVAMEGLRNELASAREEVVSLERAKRAVQERQAELEEIVEEMKRHSEQVQVATSHDGGKEAETKMLRDMLRERDAEIATLRRQTVEASRHDSDVEAVWMLLGGKSRASMSLLEGVGAVVKDRERLRVEVARNSDQLADASDSISKVERALSMRKRGGGGAIHEQVEELVSVEARGSRMQAESSERGALMELVGASTEVEAMEKVTALRARHREVDAFRKAFCALCGSPPDSSLSDCLAFVAHSLASAPRGSSTAAATATVAPAAAAHTSTAAPINRLELASQDVEAAQAVQMAAAVKQVASEPLRKEVASEPLRKEVASEPLRKEVASEPLRKEVASEPLRKEEEEGQQQAGPGEDSASADPRAAPASALLSNIEPPPPALSSITMSPVNDLGAGIEQAAELKEPVSTIEAGPSKLKPPDPSAGEGTSTFRKEFGGSTLVEPVPVVQRARPMTAGAKLEGSAEAATDKDGSSRPRALAWEVDMRGKKGLGNEGWKTATLPRGGNVDVREISVERPAARKGGAKGDPRPEWVDLLEGGDVKEEPERRVQGVVWTVDPTKEVVPPAEEKVERRKSKGLAWVVDPTVTSQPNKTSDGPPPMSDLQLACMRHVRSVQARQSLGGTIAGSSVSDVSRR